MKLTVAAKYLSVSVLALGLVVGCASQPKQEAQPAPQKQEQSAAVTQALAAAEAAIKEAKSLNLANKAREQALDAINQYYLEKAKVALQELRGYGGLSAEQQNALQQGEAAVATADGKRAYDILSALLAEVKAANIQYTVQRGDSLWAISGKAEIYNNPYQWPLIYKANADKIKDADLIYPGQEFSIDRNPSAAEVDAAIEHAKTRGAWSLGEVEESDRAYLGGLRVR